MRFNGVYTHKLDAKGRVSIPASHRPELMPGDRREVLVSISVDGDCLQLRPTEFLDQLVFNADKFDEGSPERTYFEAWASELRTLTVDPEGRIVVPPEMRAEVGIGEEIVFAGSLDYIRLSNNKAYEQAVRSSFRNLPREKRPTLAKIAPAAPSLPAAAP